VCPVEEFDEEEALFDGFVTKYTAKHSTAAIQNLLALSSCPSFGGHASLLGRDSHAAMVDKAMSSHH
jgi:hypothetical protein